MSDIKLGGKGAKPAGDRDATVGAFGEHIKTELVPVFQATAQYNVLLDSKIETFTATGGTAEAVNGEFHCSTGTSVGGYGVIRSSRPDVYRAGEGTRARWTARFPTAGVENSVCWAGLFNVTDTLAIGYYGTEFCFLHQHHGAAEVRTLTISTTAAGTVDVTVNGVTTSGIAVTNSSVEQNAAEIEQALTADSAQAGFYFSQNGDTVVAVARSTGAKSSSYSITGSISGSWAQNAGGVDKTTVTVPREEWDNNPEWLDPTKGNVYQLSVPYLGYGNTRIFIHNQRTGEMQLVHTYQWANRNTQPSLAQPSLRVGYTAASLGSTTDLDIYGASMASFSEGIQPEDSEARGGTLELTSAVSTAKQVFWSGRCRREFNGVINAGEILPKTITANTDSTKPILVEVYKNLSTTQLQNWQYIDQSQSITEVETTAIALTSFTGGKLINAGSAVAGAKAVVDVGELNQYLAPGETMHIVMNVSSGSAQDATITATWDENI